MGVEDDDDDDDNDDDDGIDDDFFTAALNAEGADGSLSDAESKFSERVRSVCAMLCTRISRW